MQAQYKTYESYKDSGVPWLGEIPQDWSLERGKWIHKYKKALNKKKECENVLSLTLRGVVNNNPDSPEGLVPEDYCTYQLFNKNDLVFKLIDLENYKTSRVGLVHEDGIMSSAYIRVKPSSDSNPRFLYYFYFFMYLEGVYNKLGAGVRSTLNQTDLLDLPVPIINTSIQDSIVAFLDQKTAEIEAAIEKKQRLIELLKEQKSILINQAVTKGLNPNVPMKDSGIEWIGKIPAHWEVKKVRHLGTLINGISEGADYFGSGQPFVTYGDVYSNFVLPENLSGLAKASKSACNHYSVKRGDVFFTRTSEIAEEVGISSVCLQTVLNATFSGFVIRFRPFNSLLEPEFSGFYFRSDITRDFFVKEMNLVTRVSLGQNLLKNLPVMIPPKKEQNQISDYLKETLGEIDLVVAASQEQISQLREFKQTLIAHAVTGKIKV